MENSGALFIKVNIQVCTFALLGIYPIALEFYVHMKTYTHVHNSFIYDSASLQTAQMSFSTVVE
jgi:hypothetical protein